VAEERRSGGGEGEGEEEEERCTYLGRAVVGALVMVVWCWCEPQEWSGESCWVLGALPNKVARRGGRRQAARSLGGRWFAVEGALVEAGRLAMGALWAMIRCTCGGEGEQAQAGTALARLSARNAGKARQGKARQKQTTVWQAGGRWWKKDDSGVCDDKEALRILGDFRQAGRIRGLRLRLVQIVHGPIKSAPTRRY
jgi:hypothetical protein